MTDNVVSNNIKLSCTAPIDISYYSDGRVLLSVDRDYFCFTLSLNAKEATALATSIFAHTIGPERIKKVYETLKEKPEKALEVAQEAYEELVAGKESDMKNDEISGNSRAKLRKVKSIDTHLTFNTGESKQNNIEIYYYSCTDTLEFNVEGLFIQYAQYTITSRRNKDVRLLLRNKDDLPVGVRVLNFTKRLSSERWEIAQEVAEFLGADEGEIEMAIECARSWKPCVRAKNAEEFFLL